MRNRIMTICFFALLLFTCLLYSRSTPQSAAIQDTPIAQQFLGLNCAVGEMENELIVQLKKQAKVAESYFIRVIENGFTARELAPMMASLEEEYKIYRSQLSNKDRQITISVGREASKPFEPVIQTEEAYLQQQLKAFNLRIQYRALEGLRIIETEKSMDFLNEKAADSNFVFQTIAAELLKEGYKG